MDPHQHTAILLGASGSVGEALLDELIESQAFSRVIVLTRRPSEQRQSGQIEQVIVSPMDPSTLEHAVVDALSETAPAVGFSTLGIGAGTANLSIAEHRAVDVELNAAFARGLKQSGVVDQLVFMSAIGANIHASETGSGAAGMPRYARVKGEAEAAVMAQGPAIVSIVRPATILGSRHTPGVMAGLSKFISPLLPARFRPIRTTEIAGAMVALALQPPAKSAIYTYADMMLLIQSRLKRT